jgi:Zn ribbon nucleic-acid-binding protein
MTNTNCLAGIKCPHCGNDDAFYISGSVLAYVTDDGAEAASNASIDWDADSYTECVECGADGLLSNFTTSTI